MKVRAALLFCSLAICISACAKSESPEILLIEGKSEVDVLPTFVHNAKPEYPRGAYLSREESEVWIKMLVDPVGFPAEVYLYDNRYNAFAFEKSALEAAKKCRFTAAFKDGKPAEVWIKLKYEFRISAEDKRMDAFKRRMGGS